jgi:hypothetical protein
MHVMPWAAPQQSAVWAHFSYMPAHEGIWDVQTRPASALGWQ